MPPSLLPYESIISQSARHCQWLASRSGLMTLSPAKCCSLSCQRFHFATFGESFLAECEHVLGLRVRAARFNRRRRALQQSRRHVPAVSVVGHEAYRLLVIPHEYPGDPRSVLGLDAHALATLELEHRRMRAQLGEHLQTSDDAVVEVDEPGFGQSVEINLHGRCSRGSATECSCARNARTAATTCDWAA